MLETTDLLLIPYSPQQLLALINEPHRFEEIGGFPAADGLRSFIISDDVSPVFLELLRGAREADPWIYGFAIVLREKRCIIGNAAFKGPPDDEGVVEVGYGIVPQFQGRGYASAATQALLEFATADQSVRIVRAHTLPERSASTRVLEKCGFEFIGEVVDPEDGPVWRWELWCARWRATS
jgi:[ribosomal protein S5]-alanine N-acetyltransferase